MLYDLFTSVSNAYRLLHFDKKSVASILHRLHEECDMYFYPLGKHPIVYMTWDRCRGEKEWEAFVKELLLQVSFDRDDGLCGMVRQSNLDSDIKGMWLSEFNEYFCGEWLALEIIKHENFYELSPTMHSMKPNDALCRKIELSIVNGWCGEINPKSF